MKKVTVMLAVLIGFFAPQSHAESENSEFIERYSAYVRLGLTPTLKEMQKEGKKYGVSSDEVMRRFLIWQYPPEDLAIANAETKGAVDNNLEVKSKFAIKLGNTTQSRPSKRISKRLLDLIAQVGIERKKRDVDGFIKTEVEINRVGHLVANRADTEGDMMAIKSEMPPSYGDRNLTAERTQILSEIDNYMSADGNENEDVNGFHHKLVDDMFNPYVEHVNAYVRLHPNVRGALN